MARLFSLSVGVSVLLLGASGCGPATGTVSGTVTMDGQPLDSGIISFSAAEGASPPVTADIVQGAYSAKMVAGKKFVQISAPLLTGKRKQYDAPDAPEDDVWEERLPNKYHSESKLEFQVNPGGNSKDWAVESIRGKRR